MSFSVISSNATVSNTVTVSTAGLEIDNSAWSQGVDGIVTGAEVADLNVDGSPEVYVYLKSTGADAKGSVVAYVANNRKSLSIASMAPLSETPGAADGYQGQDEFTALEGVLGRRFPIHDESGGLTGKTRQMQYKLTAGEAGWTLKLDRTTEFQSSMIDPARTVSGGGRAGAAAAIAQAFRVALSAWRRVDAAGEGLGALWLQLDAAPCRTPGKPWLPDCSRRRGDRNQLAVLGDRQGLSGGETAAGERAAIPGAIAAYRLSCSTRAGSQHGESISIGGDEAATMIGLERAETAATQPPRLIFPDGIDGERRRRAGQCCDLSIGGAELRIAANQRVGCILRARAVGLELFERRRHRGRLSRRLSRRWAGAGHKQQQP